MELYTELPNNLRRYRKAMQLRQKDVALILGFKSEDRISLWEKGLAAPSINNLFKLGCLYNIAPEELYKELVQKVSFTINKRRHMRAKIVNAPKYYHTVATD
ncbi:MAG: helix-turn-helix transcriptional regulator [Flaviaesturariibacter sp.]|nr:helix-turn-helix transcriptional regulator [Flaviaesturariibacter sp.]